MLVGLCPEGERGVFQGGDREMREDWGLPVHGTDAEGADTYVELIAAAPGNREYRHLIAIASTFPAMLSLDGGVTDHVWVPAGGGVCLDDVQITKSVQGKNGGAGNKYSALHVMVW